MSILLVTLYQFTHFSGIYTLTDHLESMTCEHQELPKKSSLLMSSSQGVPQAEHSKHHHKLDFSLADSSRCTQIPGS